VSQSEPAAPRGDRLRFKFAKLGKVCWTSQRDVARMWERALRRGALPVAWSQGFSPHPLLSFGLALPTGCESVAEYLDVRLDGDAPPLHELDSGLSPLLPHGVDVLSAAAVPMGSGSLQQDVTSCTWELEVLGLARDDLAGRVERLLGASSVVVTRERKGRLVEDDLRPAVLSLQLLADSPAMGPRTLRLRADLATKPRGIRPGELALGLGGVVLRRTRRTHQWIERDGARFEPLDSTGSRSAACALHAAGRAS